MSVSFTHELKALSGNAERRGGLRVLLVATEVWAQTTRLAMRFAAYGCNIAAVCTPASQLHHLCRLQQVAAGYPLRITRPLPCLVRAIKQSGAELLVPSDDLAVRLLHALAEEYPALAPLIERSIGAARGFAVVRSRQQLLELARDLGIDVPVSRRVHTLDELESWAATGPLPFVLKKDGTFGGGGVSVVEDRAAVSQRYAQLTTQAPSPLQWKQRLLRRNLADLMALPSLGKPGISVQAYIEGTPANAMFAADGGRILGSVVARVVASRGKTGPALLIQLMEDLRIEQAGRLLAEALGLSGFFGLDFILQAGTGVPLLIEMNPRCTQLGHIALAGQPDLAGVLWSHWTGRPAPEQGDASLSKSIAFYPQALEWAPDSAFLRHARYDVGESERAFIDRLPVGNQSLKAKVYRAGRASLRTWRQGAPDIPGDEVFYFAAPQRGSTRIVLNQGPAR